MKEIWVIKATGEKNPNDGIEYFTNKEAMAEAVHELENLDFYVQVYKCVPVKHEVYVQRFNIELYE